MVCHFERLRVGALAGMHSRKISYREYVVERSTFGRLLLKGRKKSLAGLLGKSPIRFYVYA